MTAPKSTVERSKMQKNRPETRTNAARTQNAAWKRPRAKNSANIAPKHRQIGSPAGGGSLPLKHVRKALMLYLKHIGLTRLGTDSGAADLTAPPCHRPLSVRLFARSLVRSVVRSFVRTFVRSFVRSFFRSAVYPPRMAPIGAKLCQNAFQTIPDI